MKKTIIIVTIFMILIGIFLCINKTYAAEKAIDNETESKIIEIKENAMNSLEDYKQKYGSDAYGFVAYILNLVRIYSTRGAYNYVTMNGDVAFLFTL